MSEYQYDPDGMPLARVIGHDNDGLPILEDLGEPIEYPDPLGDWHEVDYTTHAAWIRAQVAAAPRQLPRDDEAPAEIIPTKRPRVRTRKGA